MKKPSGCAQIGSSRNSSICAKKPCDGRRIILPVCPIGNHKIPGSLNDRAQDSWRPLLAIADLAGKRWAEYGRESAIKLSGEKSEASKRALLLSDIKAIFEKAQVKSNSQRRDLCQARGYRRAPLARVAQRAADHSEATGSVTGTSGDPAKAAENGRGKCPGLRTG